MVVIVTGVIMPGATVVVVAVIVVVRVAVSVVVGVVGVGRGVQGSRARAHSQLSPMSQHRCPGVVLAGLRVAA